MRRSSVTSSPDRTDYRNQLREAGGEKVKRTICEVHREIYDRLEALGLTEDPVVALLEEAYALGKKMDLKLRQHDLRVGDEWYAAERPAVLADTLARRRARQVERKEADRLARHEKWLLTHPPAPTPPDAAADADE